MNMRKNLKKWAQKGFKFSGIDRPGVRDRTGPYKPNATKKEIEDAKEKDQCPTGGKRKLKKRDKKQDREQDKKQDRKRDRRHWDKDEK